MRHPAQEVNAWIVGIDIHMHSHTATLPDARGWLAEHEAADGVIGGECRRLPNRTP